MATASRLVLAARAATKLANNQGGQRQPNVIIGVMGQIGGAIVSGLGSGLNFMRRFAGFSLRAIWAGLAGGISFLWNFNWNISDQQIEADIRGRLISLAGYWGGVVGQTLGSIVCGAVPGAVVTKFNPAMGAYILKEVGEEAADEIASEIAMAVDYSIRSFGSMLFMRGYQNVRRWFYGENNTVAQALLGGNYAEARQRYLEGRQKSWSFAQGFENWIESIPNPITQAFTENLFDEAFDACVEAGFVVAGAAEDFIIEQEFAKFGILGKGEGTSNPTGAMRVRKSS